MGDPSILSAQQHLLLLLTRPPEDTSPMTQQDPDSDCLMGNIQAENKVKTSHLSQTENHEVYVRHACARLSQESWVGIS